MKRVESLVGGSLIKAILIFSLSTLSLLCIENWLSPNYNHLAFIGCLLVTGALIRSGPLDEVSSVSFLSFGMPLLSGIVIATLAKPTTGFVVGLVCLLYAFCLSKSSRQLMILCLLLSILLTVFISALFAGGFSELFAAVMLGKEWASLLGAGHDAAGLIAHVLRAFSPLHMPLLMSPWAFTVQVAIIFSFFSQKSSRGFALKVIFIALASFFSWYTFVYHRDLLSRDWPTIGTIWFAVLPFSFLMLLVLDKSFFFIKDRTAFSFSVFRRLIRALLILLIPFGFAFGTNTGLWWKILNASIIFVSLAATFMVKLSPQHFKRVFAAFLLCVAIGDLMLVPIHSRFYMQPYRQSQALFLNNNPTRVGPSSELILSEEYSKYIKNAQEALMINGFRSGSPVLDLSGLSPGLIYALDGRAIGFPWIIGVNAHASAIFDKIPCNDLHSAWLLVEPDGPQSIDLSILNDFNIDILDKNKYKMVAHLVTPKGAAGIEFERHQFVYKPLLAAEDGDKCSSLV